MNKEEKIEMLRACLVVREHLFNNFDLIFIESGLCWQIAHQLNRDLFPNRYSLIISDVLSRYFRIWSKFSGNRTFPLPGKQRSYNRRRLWEGDQLELRKELLNHLVDSIEADLIANHGWDK